MPRKSIPSTSLVQAVRRHFGLHQFELAAYLGVGRAMVGHLEAGRRPLPTPVLLRLAPLASLLPPAETIAEAAKPELLPPAAAPLAARLDQCQHEAAHLRRTLSRMSQQLEHARRWQQALPALLAAADERARPWLLRRQEQATADLDAEASAGYHLLRLRAEALEAEAAALAALLPPPVAVAT